MLNNERAQDDPNWKTATEFKLKHLEMIQAEIIRMGNNSLLVKGWCVTMLTALFTFGGKEGKPQLIFMAYFPLLMFWYLDGLFLLRERLFRKIYDYKRTQPETDFALSPIDIPSEKREIDSVSRVMFSNTLRIFYGLTFLALIVATIILNEAIRNWLKSHLHIG